MSDAALASLLTSKLAKADSVLLLRDAMAKTQANPNILITVFDQPGNVDNGSDPQVKTTSTPILPAERCVRFKVGPDDVISDPAVNVAHFGSAAALTTVASSLMDVGTSRERSPALTPAGPGRDTLSLNPADVASRLEQLVILRAQRALPTPTPTPTPPVNKLASSFRSGATTHIPFRKGQAKHHQQSHSTPSAQQPQQQFAAVQFLTSPQGSPPPSTSDSTASIYAPIQAVTPAPSLILVNGTNTGHRVYAWQQLQSQSGYHPPTATPAGSMVFLHQQPQPPQQSLPSSMHPLAHAASTNGSTLLYASVPNPTPSSSMIFQPPSAPMSTPSRHVTIPCTFAPQAPANTPMQSMAILHDFFNTAPPSTPVSSISHLASPSSGRASPRTHPKGNRAPSPSRVASQLRNQFGSTSSKEAMSEVPAESQNAPLCSNGTQRYKTVSSSTSMGSLFALGGGVSAPQNSMLSLDQVTAAPHNSTANFGTGMAVNSSSALQNQILHQLQQQQLRQQGMASPGNVSPTSRSRLPSGRSRSLVGGAHGLGAPLESIGELSAASTTAPKAPANSRMGSMVFPSSAQQHQYPHFMYGGDNGLVPLAPASSRVDNSMLGGQDMGSMMMMPVPNAPPGSVAGSMYFGPPQHQPYAVQAPGPIMGSMMFSPEVLGSAPPNSRMGSMVFAPSTSGAVPGGSRFGSALFGVEQLGAAPPNSRAGSTMFFPYPQVVTPAESQMGSVFLGKDSQAVAPPPNSRMGSMMLADNGTQARNQVHMPFKAEGPQTQPQPHSTSTLESASPKDALSCEAVDNGRNLTSPHVNVMHFNSSNVSMETVAPGENSGSSSPGEPASASGSGKKSPITQPKLTPVSEEKHHLQASESPDDQDHSEHDDRASSNQQHHAQVPQIVVNPGTPAVLSTTSISSIPYLMRSLAPEHQLPSTSTVLLHRPPPNSLVNIAGHVQTNDFGHAMSMDFAGNRSTSHATVMYPYPTAPPPSMYLHSVGDLQASFNTGAMMPTGSYYGSGSHSAVAQHIQSMTNGLSMQQQLEYERRIHEVNMHLIRVAAQRDAAQLALAHMQDQHALAMMQHQVMSGMVPVGPGLHAMVGDQGQRVGLFQQHAAHHQQTSPHLGHNNQQHVSQGQDYHRHHHDHQQHHRTGPSHKPATNASAATNDRILGRLEQAIGPHLSQEPTQRSRPGAASPEQHSPPVGTTPKTVQMVGGVKVTKVRRGSFESNASGHAGSEVDHEHAKGQWRPHGTAGM
ncbi:hypothetical protein BCR44DRAFT_1509455 [Catenaria anguillulae PL171]|uniref:Uncharacterized protein n=1 Tax=Catenaria anguillulae PL171 TaxID=765915 RepID=A0A1Y2I1R9_9FUNG|nr:hypothetical protein BCR44DRAFT_1509455 [Catenaria anguillulae PL171]